MRFDRKLAACALLLLGAAPKDTPATVRPPAMEGERMAFVGVGGATDCAGFLRAVAVERQARPPGAEMEDVFRTTLYGALIGWADGYITAKNELDAVQRSAGGYTKLEQRGRWLELFCQANPQAPFFAAAYKLREHLVAEGM